MGEISDMNCMDFIKFFYFVVISFDLFTLSTGAIEYTDCISAEG